MRYYELTYLINNNLSEEERKRLSEKVVSFLPNPPTKIEEQSSLTTLEFYSQPEKLKEIEKNLKADSQVLRFMILIKEVSQMKVRRTARRSSFAETLSGGRQTTEHKPEKNPEEKKVELKEIEKKLDEILKE